MSGLPKKPCGPLVLGTFLLTVLGSVSYAQSRPYIGYVYPAGGRQGTTFTVKIGGQGLDGVNGVLVTGSGVTGRILDYYGRLGSTDMSLLNEQLKELREEAKKSKEVADPKGEKGRVMARIQARLDEYVNQPACASIAMIVFAEITIAPDAEPGEREIRLSTATGISNPMAFHVGQLPEISRKAMRPSPFQVLGKEEQALRQRPADEVEQRLEVPGVANGQIARGEVNWYRFAAKKGQRLVFSVAARRLVPYIADAVPGWFQPILAVFDENGRELAFNDDYRFHPDPVLLFEPPRDGEYRFSITDALYRGREDFVYRVTVGEVPFITSIFPLGGPAGKAAKVEVKGWNLEGAVVKTPPPEAAPGVHEIFAIRGGIHSNRVPFAVDTLPEAFEKEPNDTPAAAQEVRLPILINGRMNRPGDVDVFRFEGRAGDTLVAEVLARRLHSPLDSIVRVTDAKGTLLALNDDHTDAGEGLQTHHADSYLMVKLPSDGPVFVHITDTARQGGEEYGYRLRISPPRPDFALRVMPSSVSLRSKSSATLTVFAIRRDGFTGEIRLSLKDPPEGFSASPVVLKADKDEERISFKTTLTATPVPVGLVVQGTAKVDGQEIVRTAVPAEDRMQAFLWRHLAPAKDLRALVFDPTFKPAPKRAPPPAPLLKPSAPAPAPAEGMMEMMAAGAAAKVPGAPAPPSKPAEAKAVVPTAKPTDAKPASPGPDAKPPGPQAPPALPPATKPAEAKAPSPAPEKPPDSMMESMAAESKPPASKPPEAKAPEAKPPAGKPAEVKKEEPKPAEAKKPEPPKFTKQQVQGRLRQLKILYEEWLLTEDFYARKVAECEAAAQ